MHALKLIIAAVATTVIGTSAMAAGETVLVAGATGKSGVPLVKILQWRSTACAALGQSSWEQRKRSARARRRPSR